MKDIINLGIDIDGTIRNWINKVIEVYKREMPGKGIKEPINQYEISPFFEIGRNIYDYIFGEWAEEIYTRAQPYPGALEFIGQLKKMNNIKITFISYQPNDAIKAFTNRWLLQNGFIYFKPRHDQSIYMLDPDVIYTDKKEDCDIDILLDDCTDNLRKAEENGIIAFAIQRDWNKDWHGRTISKYQLLIDFINSPGFKIAQYEALKRKTNRWLIKTDIKTDDGLGMGLNTEIITNEQGGQQSKLPYRFDLTDPLADLKLAEVLAYGAEKYAIDNWRLIDIESHLNHAMAHIAAFKAGDNTDDHLGHALCRLHMAVAKFLRPYYLGKAI